MTLFLLNPAYAAQTTRTIKGIIVAAEDKEPVIGATVAVSQTQLKKSGTTNLSEPSQILTAISN